MSDTFTPEPDNKTLYDLLHVIIDKLPFRSEGEQTEAHDTVNALDPNYVAPPAPTAQPQPLDQVAAVAPEAVDPTAGQTVPTPPAATDAPPAA